MVDKLFKKIHQNKVIINSFTVLISVTVYFLILANRTPGFLRTLSMLSRTGFSLVVPVFMVLLYFSFRAPGWIGRFLSLLVTLCIFSLALAGLWASGKTEVGLLSGVIPMFDASTYYTDAVRLLVGDEFSLTSTRRPLPAAFLAFLLFISAHNLLILYGILTLMAASCCYFVVCEIQTTHGPATATLVMTILFVFYRFHSGSPRTESLGIALGSLGIALLWRSLGEKKLFMAIFGTFLFAMAMLVRPGAFVFLPLLVLWGSWYYRPPGRKISWIFLTTGVGIGLAILVFNQFLIDTFGTSEAIAFENFSYTLWGLASGGKNWAQVFVEHPELTGQGYDPMEIYRLAIDLILEKPQLFLIGIFKNWSIFLSNSIYGVYSYMAGSTLLINQLVYWALLLLCLLSVISWIGDRKNPYATFIVISIVGIMLTVPFIQPLDTFRVRSHASNIALFGMIPALGLHFTGQTLKRITFVKERFPGKSSFDTYGWGNAVVWTGAILIILVIFTPFIVKGVETRPIPGSSSCDPDQTSLVVRYDLGTNIDLVAQEEIFLDWAPKLHIGTFRKSVHDFPDSAFIRWSENVKPGHSLFYGLDFRTDSKVVVMLPTEYVPDSPKIIEICGHWETEKSVSQYNIFLGKSVAHYY